MTGPEDEAGIKKLLVSDDETDRKRGLKELDEAYRETISGRVRYWSNTQGNGLTADDISEIWRETVKAVVRNVAAGNFEFDGRLAAYLAKIARRRAIDLLRKRITLVSKFPFLYAPTPESIDELLEALRVWCRKDNLSEGLQIVLLTDVELFLQSGGQWVSRRELTREVNQRYELDLPETTIKGRRPRAQKELKKILKKRGYGG